MTGTGLIPYYMWNATDGMYSNVFYGANFVGYVGDVTDKLTMVRPVNGTHYETYILDQYFDLRIDGAAGADDVTLSAIGAINDIPERVAYSDKAKVEAARAAYDKIATKEQQALVTNYDVLVSAEQRIKALTPNTEPEATTPQGSDDVRADHGWLACVVIALGVAGVAVVAFKGKIVRKKAVGSEDAQGPTEAEAQDK